MVVIYADDVIYSQDILLMDYQTRVIQNDISIETIYDLGKVSREEWELLKEKGIVVSRDTIEKTIYFYNCDTLESITNYYCSKVGEELAKNSRVVLSINGDQVIESTTAFIMGREFTLEEKYGLNYFWITKLSKFNLKQLEKLGSSRKSILEGNRIVNEGTNDTLYVVRYYDTNELLVRDEIYLTGEDFTEVIINQVGLNKPFSIRYDHKGNVIKKFGRNISYIYDDEGGVGFC